MDSKLQKLLDQISWDESKKSYFEGATLEKIVGNSEHTDYTFVISLSDLLPSEIFDEFIHVLKEGFKEQVKSTRVRFQVENPDLGKVKEYFTYLMNRYAKKCPILESFIESEVEIKEDVLIIPVDYLSEEQKLFSLEKELVMDFRSFGFAISRINPVLKEDPISVLEEESEIVVEQARLEQKDVIVEDKPAWKKNFTPKKIETVDDPNVLLGRVIDTNVVRLDTISGPTNGVTLEAELFGIEERETKTDLIIVTLKITDYTDSIYAKIFVNGKEAKINAPIDAMKLGMAYLPEDRKQDGIIADLSVRENIILALQAKKGMFHLMSRKEMEEAADKYIEMLQVKTASRETPIKSLSGGNQQKVIIGRWLLTNPEYLILDEPTRGIDIGTKTEIQKLVLNLADQGMSVTFISSEVEEMLRTCSRMGVMRDGKKVGELTGDDLSQEGVMKAIAGGDGNE